MEKIVANFKHFGLYFFVGLRSYISFFIFIGIGIFLSIGGTSLIYSKYSPETTKMFLDGSFWMFMNIGGIVITTSSFAIFSRPSMRMHLLTIPASSLTRAVVLIIIGIPLILLSNTLVFTVISYAISMFMSFSGYVKSFDFNPFNVDGTGNFLSHLYFYITIQSILLMIGSFYKKLGIFKTAFTIVILFLLYILISKVFANGQIDKDFFSNLYNVLTSDVYKFSRLREYIPVLSILYKILIFIIVPFSWYIVYLRLKEMEV